MKVKECDAKSIRKGMAGWGKGKNERGSDDERTKSLKERKRNEGGERN